MSRNNTPKKRPYGYASAILPGPDGEDRFVRLAPVWENRDGSLSIQLDLCPVLWGDPTQTRKIIIQKARDDR